MGIIAWDIEKNQTKIIERKGTRISKLLFTNDDSWLIIGRNNGKLQFWNVYNENNKKLKLYYKYENENNKNHNQNENENENGKNENKNGKNENENKITSLFQKKYEETI